MRASTGYPSLLIITIDCLRADHVGFLGYRHAITPNMDHLAAESLVFTNALVAGSPTYYAFPALLGGRYPLAMGREVIGLCPDETTLASHLRYQGYQTGAIVAGNPYLSRWMGYNQGFDHFEDFLQERRFARQQAPSSLTASEPPLRTRLNRLLKRLTGVSPGLKAIYEELYFTYSLLVTSWVGDRNVNQLLRIYQPADVITDRAIDWLKPRQQPFFLWLHYMDAHRPYNPPATMLEKLNREDLSARKQFRLRHLWLRKDLSVKRLRRYRQDFMDLYDACILSIDSQVGRLIKALGVKGLLENTIIVLTADHGEAFLEREASDHIPVLATQEIIRVPLLIRSPQDRATHLAPVAQPFSHIDLLPTVLEMAGLDCPPSFSGLSRWSALQNREPWEDPAITEMVYSYGLNPLQRINAPGHRLLSASTDRYKLTINFAKGSEELFDLEHDPQELRGHPLSHNPQVSIKLLRALRQHLEKILNNRYSNAELKLRFNSVREFVLQLSQDRDQSNI